MKLNIKNIPREDLENLYLINKKKIYFLMFFLICILVVLSGSLMNIRVINSNDGKMPVKCTYCIEDREHFNYNNDSEIKYPYLSDRIKINNMVYSIGNLVMYFGFGLLIISCLFLIYMSYKEEKLIKRLKKNE